ncbi:hypothetical protein KR038_012071 [Drosophila bunnanda]|nr:hypothetical protein KR038_012071 [Drosophila bunnanda]
MSMQNRSFITVGIWLLPMLILSSVGPSGNNEAKKSPDFGIPWTGQNSDRKDQNKGRDQMSPESHFSPPDINLLFKQLDDLERTEETEDKIEEPGKFQYPISSQTSTHSESLPVTSVTHTLERDKYHDFLGPLDLEQLNAAGVGEFEQVMGFQRANDWGGKTFPGQFNTLPSGAPKSKGGLIATTTPSTIKTTAVIRPSTYCIPDSSPFRPATAKIPAPPTPPTTSTPSTIQTTRKPLPLSTTTTAIPNTKKVQSGPKCRKKSKKLSVKKAKILLEIILSTKKQVLSVLKTLNYMEMEVLSQSSDDCPLKDLALEQSNLKKKPNKQIKKLQKPNSSSYSQAFFFGIRPASQMESDSDMALAREEEQKLKNRVWKEYQQQMRDMPNTKSRRLQMSPQTAVRLVDVREPKRTQESLEQKNPLKHLYNKDTSDFGATCNAADRNEVP